MNEKNKNHIDNGTQKENGNKGGGRYNIFFSRVYVICKKISWVNSVAIISSFISLYFSFAAYTTTVDQFNISKEPFIKINSFSIDSIYVGKSPLLNFELENIGEYPIKADIGYIGFATKTSEPSTSDIYNKNEFSYSINNYFVKGKSEFIKRELNVPLKENNIAPVLMMDGYFFYITLVIDYTNIALKKKKRYELVIKYKIYKDGGNSYEIVRNENI